MRTARRRLLRHLRHRHRQRRRHLPRLRRLHRLRQLLSRRLSLRRCLHRLSQHSNGMARAVLAVWMDSQ
jgi:hypothetical protein